MGKRLLVILPSTTYRARAFVQAAHRQGVELIIGTNHQQAWGELLSDTVLVFPFYEFPIALQKVKSFHQQTPLDAIIGVDDHTAWLAAYLAEHLGVAGNPESAVRRCRFKHLMRQQLLSGGILQPRFHLFHLEDNPKILADIITYPVVLKPVFLSASQGVTRVNTPDAFTEAFYRIRKLVQQGDHLRRGGRFARLLLVEQYVEGDEVAVEGLVVQGNFQLLTIFDKPDPLQGPYFQETIYVTPSRHAPPVQQFIIDETRRAVEALGIKRGAIHAELRINQHGAWVIEVAARSIGGLCSRVLHFTENATLEDVLIREALGESLESISLEKQAAGVMMMPIPASGRLVRVDGVQAARMVPGIEAVEITVTPETPVQALPEGNQYLGFIFARGNTPDAVELALRQAFRFIQVTIDTGENVEQF